MAISSKTKSTDFKHLRDGLAFARALLRNAGQVGAVAPSGEALAALITASIEPGCAPVIELGPGTGVFTRALLARGIREEELVLIESDPTFAEVVGAQFPRSHTLLLDAAQLRAVRLFQGELAGAIISGLPLLAMPRPKVRAILGGSFTHLRQDGAMYQFTYGLRCPVPQAMLDELGLQAMRVGSTHANLPPATVYRISRLSACEANVRDDGRFILSTPVSTRHAAIARSPQGRNRLLPE